MRLIFSIVLIFILTLPVKSQSWHPLDVPFFPGGYIYEIAAIDSDLYIGGSFQLYIGNDTIYGIVKWNGLQWDSLSKGIMNSCTQWGFYSPGTVNAIKKYNGKIYVGGGFKDAGADCKTAIMLAEWDGANWEGVNTIFESNLDKIRAMEIYNDKLVVVGSFDSLGNSNSSIYSNCCIAAWDSSGWSLFQGGDLNGSANSIVFNGELYVGGSFGTAGGVTVNGIGRWNGSTWKPCGLGSSEPIGDVVIDSANNILYALSGVYVYNADSTAIFTNGVSRWNGQEWEQIPPHWYIGKQSLQIYHGKLYAGATQSPRFTAFDGKEWQALDYFNNTITEFGIYKDTLFVGGFFDTIVDSNGDTIDAPYLVRYWTPNYCDSIHSFTLSADTVYISDSTIVQFAPAGFANQYQWNFTDGIIDTAELQSYYFDSAGVNYVKLIATYGLCPWDTVIKTVTVIDDCQQTIITIPDTVVKNTLIQFSGNNPEATQWQWLLGSTLISDTTNAIYFFDSAGTFTVTVTTSYKNCYDTVTATVVVVNALGVEGLAVGSSGRQLRIYPNPAGGSFTVEIPSSKDKGKSSKVEIYDVKGRLVYQSEITSSKMEIPSKGWAKGNYFVNLVLEGKTVAKEKVVVK